MVVKAGYRQERVLTYREQHVCILGLTTGRDSSPKGVPVLGFLLSAIIIYSATLLSRWFRCLPDLLCEDSLCLTG